MALNRRIPHPVSPSSSPSSSYASWLTNPHIPFSHCPPLFLPLFLLLLFFALLFYCLKHRIQMKGREEPQVCLLIFFLVACIPFPYSLGPKRIHQFLRSGNVGEICYFLEKLKRGGREKGGNFTHEWPILQTRRTDSAKKSLFSCF